MKAFSQNQRTDCSTFVASLPQVCCTFAASLLRFSYCSLAAEKICVLLSAASPLRCFCRFAVFYAAACIPLLRFRCFATFSVALAYSDIAAVCCDSRIVRWQDGIAPNTISVRLLALAASLNCCVGDGFDKLSWRLILRTVSFSQLFLKNIDTFLRK